MTGVANLSLRWVDRFRVRVWRFFFYFSLNNINTRTKRAFLDWCPAELCCYVECLCQNSSLLMFNLFCQNFALILNSQTRKHDSTKCKVAITWLNKIRQYGFCSWETLLFSSICFNLNFTNFLILTLFFVLLEIL